MLSHSLWIILPTFISIKKIVEKTFNCSRDCNSASFAECAVFFFNNLLFIKGYTVYRTVHKCEKKIFLVKKKPFYFFLMKGIIDVVNLFLTIIYSIIVSNNLKIPLPFEFLKKLIKLCHYN